MGLFEKVNMQDIESRMHMLEKSKDQEASESVKLNDKQRQFLKRYFKFQSYFIKKVEKDNLMKDGYLIIVPSKGSGNDDVYIVLSKNVLYMVRNEVNVLKFRLIQDRLLLEVTTYPAPAFVGCNIKTYQSFFSRLFSTLRRVLDFPSQFIVASKDGVSAKEFDNLVMYAQIEKYL